MKANSYHRRGLMLRQATWFILSSWSGVRRERNWVARVTNT